MLHHQDRPFRIIERSINEFDNMRMADLGQNVYFTLEVFASLIIFAKMLVKKFDRDLFALIGRMAQEDLAHPAFVNLPHDSVLAEQDPVWHVASHE